MPPEGSSELTICVAIPTYNRERVLVETIEQVLAQDPPADEVLVIDQTDRHEPETEAFLQSRHDSGALRWIRHSPPNLNGARNRAVWETFCDVLTFIDDDVELVPGFIHKHRVNYLDSSIVAVAGRTIQANGNGPAATTTPWVVPLGYRPFALDGKEPIRGVACFLGANHSVRVSAVRAVGGYDGNYRGPLYNEADAALELCRRQGVIVFDPAAEVYHKQCSAGGVRGTEHHHIPEYWRSFSAVYFHMKHFFPAWYFWKQVFAVQLRRRSLRREVVFRPWRLPWAVLSYSYSFLCAASLLARHHRPTCTIAPQTRHSRTIQPVDVYRTNRRRPKTHV